MVHFFFDYFYDDQGRLNSCIQNGEEYAAAHYEDDSVVWNVQNDNTTYKIIYDRFYRPSYLSFSIESDQSYQNTCTFEYAEDNSYSATVKSTLFDAKFQFSKMGELTSYTNLENTGNVKITYDSTTDEMLEKAVYINDQLEYVLSYQDNQLTRVHLLNSGGEISYSYNGNLLDRVEWTYNGSKIGQWNFRYSDNSLLTTLNLEAPEIGDRGTVMITYLENGRVDVVQTIYEGDKESQVESYVYDDYGRLLEKRRN